MAEKSNPELSVTEMANAGGVRSSFDAYLLHGRTGLNGTGPSKPTLSQEGTLGKTLDIPPLKYPQGIPAPATIADPKKPDTVDGKNDTMKPGGGPASKGIADTVTGAVTGTTGAISDSVRGLIWGAKPAPTVPKLRTLPDIARELKKNQQH